MQLEIFDEITNDTLKYVHDSTADLPDGSDVELLIASYGGEIFSAIGIVDLLKRFNTTANIIGFACSAAAVLALSCNRIVMSQNASMMLHSAWCEDIKSDDPGISRANEVQLSIIKKRCPEFSSELLRKDTWLSAEECLRLNLADDSYTMDAVTCNKYAAKLKNLSLIGESKMDERKVNEIVEDVKEEVREESAEGEAPVEMPKEDNHSLVEIVEKLSEELNALKARVLALEEPEVKKEEEVKEEIVAEGCKDQERINNIYKNIMKPQACVAIGTPKAVSQPVVNKVDYKAYKSFLNN